MLAGWAVHVALVAQVSWSVDTTQIQWGEPITLTAEWALTLEALQEGVANEEPGPIGPTPRLQVLKFFEHADGHPCCQA